MKGLLIATILAASLPVTVAAAPKPSEVESQLDACLSAPTGASTAGQIACIEADLKVQDGLMNRNYAAAIKRLNPRQQGKLRAAQRAWIAYRDAECQAQYDEDWGTLSRVNANFCVLRMTSVRAFQLAEYPEQ